MTTTIPTNASPDSTASTSKVLIVGPSWVGDMVMAQALFMTLQSAAAVAGATAVIDVLAPVWSRPLLERMPQVRRAIDLPFSHGELNLAGRYRLGHSLRKERYDQVIVLPNSFKSALLTLFTRSRKRTGWRGEARGMLLNDVRQLDTKALPLMVQRFVALGLPEGAPLPEPLPRPQLITDPASVTQAVTDMQLHLGRPVLVICPGAEFGDAKQWPAEHFASLSRQKIEDGWQVWILGSAKDTSIATVIKGQLPEDQHRHCHDLTGRTSLAQAIDLMSLAQAVVSNDSGLMHVAAALARPIVALYGSTSADFTPPLADNVQLLAIDISCRPCFERTCPLQHKRCLVDLTPQQTLNALDQVLARAGTPIHISTAGH
ncbi:MAG: lipopolysaccharide heptosyltransferase II [Gammaproteobacteria bacterium]|nr:lipopolysaccharide heptosyltransferase II [Gammaproteobacteria bacterium]MDP2346487.1 lipopolysaccharide heptosyltransferase II [Gammaproteobacteria bacterium]